MKEADVPVGLAASSSASLLEDDTARRSRRPSASELLKTPGGLLHRGDLAELGLERVQIDSVFRHLDVIFLPDCRRGLVRSEDVRSFLDRSTYGPHDVRPTGRQAA